MQFKKTLTAKSMVAALAIGYASGAAAVIPEPGAVAESWLQLSNFTILEGDVALGTTATGLNPEIAIVGVTTDANVNVDLNGANDAAASPPGVDVGDPFQITVDLGAGFTPNVLVPFGNVDPAMNIGPTTYVGADSSSVGNATDGVTMNDGTACGNGIVGDCVSTHVGVNLTNYGDSGGGTANQNFEASFTFQVEESGWVEMAFDADAFLRAALGQFGLAANANFRWEVAVAIAGGPDIFTWSPDGEVNQDDLGLCVGLNNSGEGQDCYEYADDFDLTDTVATGVFPIDTVDPSILGPSEWEEEKSGSFEAELFLLGGQAGGPPAAYTLRIAHVLGANAAIVNIPEPGTLALMGLGLVGAGFRRKLSK